MAMLNSLLAAFLAAVCVLVRVDGRTIEVDWTPDGVSAFNSPSTPLRAELGDVLILNCRIPDASNLFIQSEQIQHNLCDATAGAGKFVFNGFCLPGSILKLTLIMNSRDLNSTINFENNRIFYLTSYSNGALRHANNASINSGGQCSDGLRMAVLIGDWPESTGTVSTIPPPPQGPGNPGTVVNGGSSSTFNVSMLYTIVPAVLGSILVIAVAIVITIFLIRVCYSKSRKPDDPLSHHNHAIDLHQDKEKSNYTLVPSDDQGSPRRNTLGLITTQTFGTQPNYYVDSFRVASGRERSASRWSDQVGPSDQTTSSEVTVTQQVKASQEELYPKPSSSTTRNTSHYNYSLPPSAPGSRRTSHDEYATYANMTETDLPSHYSIVGKQEGGSSPSSFSHQNVWRLV